MQKASDIESNDTSTENSDIVSNQQLELYTSIDNDTKQIYCLAFFLLVFVIIIIAIGR
jgi:hypothetical protein